MIGSEMPTGDSRSGVAMVFAFLFVVTAIGCGVVSCAKETNAQAAEREAQAERDSYYTDRVQVITPADGVRCALWVSSDVRGGAAMSCDWSKP